MKLFQVNIWSEYREHTGLDVKLKVGVHAREVEELVYKELEEEYGYARNHYEIDVIEVDSVDGYEVILR